MPRLPRILLSSGAVIALLCALAHTIGHLAGPDAPKNATEKQLLDLLTSYAFEVPGGQRTLWQFMTGFSWTFSVLFLLLGVLPLAVLRLRPEDGPLLRLIAGLETIACGLLLAISLRYFFVAPSTFIGLALLAFGGSWISSLRR